VGGQAENQNEGGEKNERGLQETQTTRRYLKKGGDRTTAKTFRGRVWEPARKDAWKDQLNLKKKGPMMY